MSATTELLPSDLVTVFLSSSPRPQDSRADDAGAIMLHQALLSVRRTLGLEGAPAVCVFDGRHPEITDEQWAAYQRKISLVRADPLFADVAIVEHSEWLHQAHGLKRAMAQAMRAADRPRPIVFSIQDDTVVFGDVDARHICAALLHDPTVEYFKLFWRRDLFGSDLSYEARPGTPHPSSALLHKTRFWSDRPHFATVEHYSRRVWPRVGEADRVTMEQVCEAASSEQGGEDWGLWIYGPRMDMRRESHSKYARRGAGRGGEEGGEVSSYFVRGSGGGGDSGGGVGDVGREEGGGGGAGAGGAIV
jgi:hypothetical protein